MKYPIGIQSFDQIREDGFVYVDKTDLIYDLVMNGKIYFLSRPRRFGKSLLVSTLACYFQGRKELFDGLAIASLEKDWLQYPIFRVDFNGGNYTREAELEKSIETYIAKWEVEYGKDPLETTTGDRFKGVLQRAYQKTGQRAVVLIDEYDKPILDVLDTGAFTRNHEGEKLLLEEHHREVLKSFYSTFKGADEYLKFVLLTGVTKFSQVSVFSGFNQPKDISLDERYESLCGITQEELEKYFEEPISRLATKYECTVEEMKDWLKRQYDGYHFSTSMADIYNPFSLLNTFDMNEIHNYWFSTGTPTYLIRLLQHNHEQMNELTGKFYKPSLFVDYKADVEQPLPMIYQSGYLTIKEYNKRMGTYLLDFPNNEVREGFLSVLAANYMKPKSKEVTSWITDAVMDLEQGDTDAFRRSLTSFLASIPYDSHGSLKDIDITEKHFQYTFYLLLRLIGVYCTAIHCEDRQSYGRVDCTLEMENYVYIFEFKMDGTAQEALEQIEKTGYAKPYLADRRKVVCIGVNFSSATRTVEDWEEISIISQTKSY
ncbi:MAG: ATP-binding protein [Bacteroides acidifaciens]|uniref:ATP-binding protein n=1 Tax=Bacteroides acidifaciens TaxID=85831 RepID=UPI0023D0F055|nr:ATP-binding protein [Bacteroides acidifaciens]MDE6822851.1 ATP-binding protein [Bacteroides acidifaciens]MDE6987562.1 ATP-binding protein [Bacteroides acidifaciens]